MNLRVRFIGSLVIMMILNCLQPFFQHQNLEDKAIVLGDWLLVLLNSHYPQHVAGLLGRTELSRLDHYLNQHNDKHAMLFLHHPPVPVGSAWLDKSRLTNPDDLFNITDKHSNVRGIISGHAHQAYETHRQGVPILTAPSTCIQFLSHSQQFALDTLSPGYRWIELLSDGKFKTGVERVKDFENTADFSAKGY
jgi:Icc protein